MTQLTSEAVTASVRELPALPAVVMELLQSMGDSSISAEQLAAKISHDQALAAKTLRLANSSFYGMSRQVTSIAEATTILGLRTLRSIATAAGLIGNFSGSKCPGFDFNGFWRHAIATALCARLLAQARQLDDDTAFTLGLLHDIGRLALVSGFAETYAEVLAYQHAHDCLPLQAEQEVLGTDHAVIGGLIAEHWHFAPSIVDAIARHHAPPLQQPLGLTDVVHVADNIAHALGLSHQSDDAVPALASASWGRLALTDSTCEHLFREAEAQHEALCQALLSQEKNP